MKREELPSAEQIKEWLGPHWSIEVVPHACGIHPWANTLAGFVLELCHNPTRRRCKVTAPTEYRLEWAAWFAALAENQPMYPGRVTACLTWLDPEPKAGGDLVCFSQLVDARDRRWEGLKTLIPLDLPQSALNTIQGRTLRVTLEVVPTPTPAERKRAARVVAVRRLPGLLFDKGFPEEIVDAIERADAEFDALEGGAA